MWREDWAGAFRHGPSPRVASNATPGNDRGTAPRVPNEVRSVTRSCRLAARIASAIATPPLRRAVRQETLVATAATVREE